MKILHISGAKGWGGNEQQMIDIIPELNILNVKNVVFGLNDSILQRECEQKNITFVTAKSNKLNKFLNYRYLKTVVAELKPDIIHLHTSDSLTVFTLSDMLFGLKTKAVFSKKGMGRSSSFLSKFKYNYKGISSIICVSENVNKDFSVILSEKNKFKTTVIHDCVSLSILDQKSDINLRQKYNLSRDCLLIGNIANHSAAKDLETLILTVDYLKNKLKRNDFKLFQIGEFSKLTPNYLELVKEKKLEDTIYFTDKIKNASSLNRQFDIFLMTSMREGGPTSVLEAMLIGVPVVSTNIGVVSEIIENGKNGFVSEVKDYIDLAKNILILISDKNKQKEFVENSKNVVQSNFNSKFIAQKTFEEYLKITKID